MAGLAALTTLLPQHLKLHYFALYADVKEPFEALRFEPVYLNWFFQSNNRENSKRGVTKMVGLIGLEPMTLRLSSACSNQLSYRPFVVQLNIAKGNGGTGVRTPDIQLAKLALYQLSYTPGRGDRPVNPSEAGRAIES